MTKTYVYLAAAVLTGALGWSDSAQTRTPDAKTSGLSQIYDAYVGGIVAGQIAINAKIGEDRYQAGAVLSTSGLVGRFYKARVEAAAEGNIDAGGLAPERFSANTLNPKKTQFVEMIYRDGAPRGIRAEPAFQPRPWQIDPKAQTGTTDPITALLTALAPAPKDRLCSKSVEVFDGRRRYAVDLGAPELRGGKIRCSALYRRVAGFKPKLMKKRPSWPFEVWLQPREDGLYHVDRVMGETPIGTAVIKARQPTG